MSGETGCYVRQGSVSNNNKRIVAFKLNLVFFFHTAD